MIIDPQWGPQFDPRDGTIGKIQLVKRWRLVRGNGACFDPQCGIYTWETEAQASARAEAFLRENPEGSPNHHFVKGLHAEEWWCYPVHFDPCASVKTFAGRLS